MRDVKISGIVYSRPFLVSLTGRGAGLVMMTSAVTRVSGIESTLCCRRLKTSVVMPSIDVGRSLGRLVLVGSGLRRTALGVLMGRIYLKGYPCEQFRRTRLSGTGREGCSVSCASSYAGGCLSGPCLFLAGGIVHPRSLGLCRNVYSGFGLINHAVRSSVLIGVVGTCKGRCCSNGLLSVLSGQFREIVGVPGGGLGRLVCGGVGYSGGYTGYKCYGSLCAAVRGRFM